MRWLRLWLLLTLVGGIAFNGEAAAPRIRKVLPHLLDREGRQSLSPSLYERDAYQAILRQNPEKCSGLRFDVQWKARAADSKRLKLRIEVRGNKAAEPSILEQAVPRNHWYHRWSSLTLDGESYRKLGGVISWRASL